MNAGQEIQFYVCGWTQGRKHYGDFREAERRAVQVFRKKERASIHAVKPDGRVFNVADISSDADGRLWTDLTWAGSQIA